MTLSQLLYIDSAPKFTSPQMKVLEEHGEVIFHKSLPREQLGPKLYLTFFKPINKIAIHVTFALSNTIP